MLVLTRKCGEEIVIGKAVVTILEVHGDKVKVGIEAPRDVEVDRREVHDRKKGEAA